MNSLVQSIYHIDTKPLISNLESPSDLLVQGQFAADIVDAFVALDEGESDTRPAETFDVDSDSPEPLKLDLDASVKSIEIVDGHKTLPVPEAKHDITEWTQPFAEAVNITLLSENPKQPVEVPQQHVIVRRSETGSLPVACQDDIPFAADQLNAVTSNSNSNSDVGPAKAKATPVTKNIMPKAIPVFSDAGLTTRVSKQQKPKAGSVEVGDILRAHPVMQTNQNISAAAISTSVAMPVAPATTPIIAPTVSAIAPSIPVLNVESNDQWISGLSRDIGQLSADKSSLNFQLKPHHLGKLYVEITTDVAGDMILLETENEHARSLIMGSQGRLEQDIRLSGIKLARLDVTAQDDGSSQRGPEDSGAQERRSELHRSRDTRLPRHSVEEHLTWEQEDVTASRYHAARYA